MKRRQAKKHKILMKLIKYLYHVLMIDKRFVLDDGVHTSAYFHKDCSKKDL